MVNTRLCRTATDALPDAGFVIPTAGSAEPSAARDLDRLPSTPGLQISRYTRNHTGIARNNLRRPPPGHRQRGVGFLALLFVLAVSSIALAGTGVLWQMESRREQEKDLLFAGEEYRRAIDRYYAATPGEAKEFPRTLDELLNDRRFQTTVRHLRRLYREPLSADGQWQLIRQQERITGVASRSTQTPIKVAGFAAGEEDFVGAQSYAQWRFTSSGGSPAPAAAASPTPSPTPTAQAAP